jgi:hypothetical protein
MNPGGGATSQKQNEPSIKTCVGQPFGNQIGLGLPKNSITITYCQTTIYIIYCNNTFKKRFIPFFV